jgi:hypothetical protein
MEHENINIPTSMYEIFFLIKNYKIGDGANLWGYV